MENVPFLSGHFLISGLGLYDPNFFRTVVLLVQHNQDGAFGLVVNRPAKHTLGTILPQMADKEAKDIPVYVGGPVQQDFLFVLHQEALPDTSYKYSPAATQPVPGLIFEPATHDLLRYLAEEWDKTEAGSRPIIRMYAGYSGWAGGQLERELREHAWFTHQANADIVFHPNPETAWEAALSEKGEYYKFVANTGYIPSVN